MEGIMAVGNGNKRCEGKKSTRMDAGSWCGGNGSGSNYGKGMAVLDRLERLSGACPRRAFAGGGNLEKAGYVDGIVLLLLGITENVEKMTGIFWGSLLLLSVFGGGLLILRRGSWRTRLPYLPFLTVTWMMVQGLGGKMPI